MLKVDMSADFSRSWGRLFVQESIILYLIYLFWPNSNKYNDFVTTYKQFCRNYSGIARNSPLLTGKVTDRQARCQQCVTLNSIR